MAIEVSSADLKKYGVNDEFKTSDGTITSAKFVSDLLSSVEEQLEEKDPVVIRLFWRDKGSDEIKSVYPWMTDTEVKNRKVFACILTLNRDRIREILHEHGIYMMIRRCEQGKSVNTVSVSEYTFSKTRFENQDENVIYPDGHSKPGKTKASVKKEVRDIVIRRLSEAADNMSNVDHPSHYNQGGIECIDALNECLGSAGFKGFCKGNAIKYLWRSGHKNSETEDLKKASWYIDKLVEVIEKEKGNG